MHHKGQYAEIDEDDVTMILPVPARHLFSHKKTNKKLYSWAYHCYETVGRKLYGHEGEFLKRLCRAKGNKIVSMYGDP